MKIGSKFKTAYGTLTVKGVTGKKGSKIITVYHESNTSDEHSSDVHMSEKRFKQMVIKRI